jgi:hypothetical protein
MILKVRRENLGPITGAARIDLDHRRTVADTEEIQHFEGMPIGISRGVLRHALRSVDEGAQLGGVDIGGAGGDRAEEGGVDEDKRQEDARSATENPIETPRDLVSLQ